MHNVEEYIHGRCQIFAFALNIALKYPMTFLWDSGYVWDDAQDIVALYENSEEEIPEPLVHAYCTRPNGTLVDASGTVTRQEVETEHGDCDEVDHREINANQVKTLMREQVIEAPEPGELMQLVRYIKANLDVYRDGTRKIGA